MDPGETIVNVIGAGILTLIGLIALELLLYYKSWSLVHGLKDRIKMHPDKKEYAADSMLSLISLLMTAILNLIFLIILALCVIAIFYAIFYRTELFPVVFISSITIIAITVLAAIRIAMHYNKQKDG
jgi:glucan phosphoethanolaminetransferase (alkaline phosphatase superfamily)